MKTIARVDDPSLVKALAHPLRIEILRRLQDRVASPSELTAELGADLRNISYHVQRLERLGLLELVQTKQRRGALEHFYRARGKLAITDQAWDQVPTIVKDAMVGATLDQVRADLSTAAAGRGFDRGDAHLTRAAVVLDEKGFRELVDAFNDLYELVGTIAKQCAERLAAATDDDAGIDAGVVLALFETDRS